jgi:RHS repeat-associated protein
MTCEDGLLIGGGCAAEGEVNRGHGRDGCVPVYRGNLANVVFEHLAHHPEQCSRQPRGERYYRARCYHSGQQRLISEDPIGLFDVDVNLYAYVFSAPLDLTDTLGMAIDPISWTAAGIACGGGALG